MKTDDREFSVRLFGTIRIAHGECELSLPNHERLLSLFASLILEPEKAQDRAMLASRLWPASTIEQGRTNLRRELHHLVRVDPAIGNRLKRGGRTIEWLRHESDYCDVTAFLDALTQAEAADDSNCRKQLLAQCLEHYGGEFLPGVSTDWATRTRRMLASRYRSALEMQMLLATHCGEHDQVILLAQRLLSVDPCDERAAEALILAYLARDEPAAAQRAYSEHEQSLARLLSAAPSGSIRALAAAIHQRTAAERASEPRLIQRAGLLPCIGRGVEQQWLMSAWREAVENGPRLVVLDGDAGIGKTRLAEWLASELARTRMRVSLSEAFRSGSAEPFAAMRRWFDPDDRDLGKLPQSDRHARFEALARSLVRNPAPQLLILDDLQWVDADTIDFLRYFLLSGANAPVMILATLRTGERIDAALVTEVLAQLQAEGQLSRLRLKSLSTPEINELIKTVVAASPIGNGVRPDEEPHKNQIQELSMGNPLHIIEWTRLAIEQPHCLPNAVPARIEAIIGRRLAALRATERRVLNLVAVADGRTQVALLSRATGFSDERMVAALDSLVDRQLIDDSDEGVTIVHETIRRIVEMGIRPVRRRLLHLRLAESLVAGHDDNANDVAAQTARHFRLAGAFADACDWAGRAATLASRAYAHHSSIEWLYDALSDIDRLPASAQHDRRRAKMLLGIASNAQAVGGLYSPTIVEACDKLEQLQPLVRCAETSAQILNRLRTRYAGGNTLPKSLTLAQQSLRATEQTDLPVIFRIEAYRALGLTYLLLGQYPQSSTHFSDAARLHGSAVADGQLEPDKPTWPIHLLHAQWPIALWAIGDEPSARATLERSRSLPLVELDLMSRVNAARYRAIACACLGDVAGVREEWQSLAGIAASGHDVMNTDLAALTGWLAMTDGKTKLAIAELIRGIRAVSTHDGGVLAPFWFTKLGSALLREGRPERALTAIRLGLTQAEKTAQHGFDAEFLRLQALALAATSADAVAVEKSFQRSLGCAKKQSALALARSTVLSRDAWLRA